MTFPISGCDYSYARPSPHALAAAGVKFAGRYGSRDPAKNATAPEVAALHAAGLGVVALWETTGTRALDGAASGTTDALTARNWWHELGLPDYRPIYLAELDNIDPRTLTGAQWDHVTAYYYAARTAGGCRPYAPRAVLDRVQLPGWQAASTYGDPGRSAFATITQEVGPGPIPGQIDTDHAWITDYGAWPPPTGADDDMTDQQARQLAHVEQMLTQMLDANDPGSLIKRLSVVESRQAQIMTKLGLPLG